MWGGGGACKDGKSPHKVLHLPCVVGFSLLGISTIGFSALLGPSGCWTQGSLCSKRWKTVQAFSPPRVKFGDVLKLKATQDIFKSVTDAAFTKLKELSLALAELLTC